MVQLPPGEHPLRLARFRGRNTMRPSARSKNAGKRVGGGCLSIGTWWVSGWPS
jgi:hypothetical protein